MRLPMLAMIILIIVNIAVDACIYIKLKNAFKTKWISLSHLVLSAFLFLYIIVAIILPRRSIDNDGLLLIMWMLFSYFTFYIPKYLFLIVNAISYIPRIWRWKQIPYISTISVLMGGYLFISMWWGALVTRTDYEVVDEIIEFNNLPAQFDGYKIVQFSDFHVGSYGNDTVFVANVVKEINRLKPNMIVFTGDIVNRETNELLPFVDILSRLRAPNGVYSILGNHDYGDYMNWATVSAKEKNMNELIALQKGMGWILLNNEHCIIKHGSDSIALLGVENWGEPPFKKYGDLNKSYPSLNDSTFKIILSHNTNHWRGEIIPKTNIDLTLSGHTHAMQIVFNFFGYKISPSVLRYKEWGGLYEDANQKLYVNIGLGEVALPMRIGATPEITLITLKKKN